MEKLELFVSLVEEFISKTYGNMPAIQYAPLKDDYTLYEIRVIYKISDKTYFYKCIIETAELENEFYATLLSILKDIVSKVLFEQISDIDNFVTSKYCSDEV